MRVQLKSIALAAVLTAASAVSVARAGDPAVMPSNDALRLIRLLEQEPLSPNAAKIRSDLIEWATATKDVMITVCDVLGPIPSKEVPYGPELLIQAMFGNGAFQLEHVQHKGDEYKAQLAGIESMLRSYERILAADPSARIPEYDEWLREREAGDLEAKVAPSIQRHCVEESAQA